MGFLGRTETLIIILVIVLLFGASRIPQLARSLGDGLREFRKGTKGEEDKAEPPKPPPPPASPAPPAG